MGNTCFMNVILQSLVHNPLLKAYFLSDNHSPKNCKTQNCMCCEMNDLFTQVKHMHRFKKKKSKNLHLRYVYSFILGINNPMDLVDFCNPLG